MSTKKEMALAMQSRAGRAKSYKPPRTNLRVDDLNLQPFREDFAEPRMSGIAQGSLGQQLAASFSLAGK